MKTLETKLIETLRRGVEGTAQRVVVGLNWTFVEGPNGAGLVHTPARGTEGCRSLPDPGSYQGRALDDLAGLTGSENIFERVLGYAAINAHHNRYDLEGVPANGLDMIKPAGKRTVVIGRFPELDEKLPGAAVIEQDPGPGDYPVEAGAELIPAAKYLAITASTLSNGSLAGLLELAPASAVTVLIGPSVPLTPALFEFGINTLSGFVPGDTDGIAQRVSEGAAVRALKPLGRYVTLTSN
ncbi:MAG: hypothetical protein HOM52_00400 [Rhodospirillaceae bacterium]|nr:hypothetical protein [Rhodospirillaceae bacterium]MBT5779498.1 hypothetical protein [Rhodospirillaceae bacterium]